MYVVDIENDGVFTEIHGDRQRLTNGNVVKGINAIDTFTFSILPFNKGFDLLHEFTTLVRVFNTNTKRYEFRGRILSCNPSMSSNGIIKNEVTCESDFGYLCDSVQPYVEEQNWTVAGLLAHIINEHNAQVEDYKRFTIGEVTVTDPNDNLYCGIQRDNSWNAISEKLVKTLGGEIQFRVEDGIRYIDYLTMTGETKTTKIAVSRNMTSIAKQKDVTAYVTRLIPLGCKLTKDVVIKDDNGEENVETIETEERLEISSVNNGVNYIEDTDAIKQYGIHVGFCEWDDVTEPSNLLAKGRDWLAENNKVQIKYSVTALELSLLGLDIDEFNVCNSHPIVNHLIGVNDVARIVKKNINISEPTKSTIEFGESFKSLSDIQMEQSSKLQNVEKTIKSIGGNYATNEKVTNETTAIHSLIAQTAENIIASVSSEYLLVADHEEYKSFVETELATFADEIALKFTTTTEQIVDVDGELQTKFEQLYKYIRFTGENAITIGSSDSAITLEVDNETGIVFKKNGVQFGLWDGNDFYTGNIVVQVNERAQFGNFAFVPRSDGSLMFLKVGGK